MKIKNIWIIVCIFILIACMNSLNNSADKRGNYMKWKDPFFKEICSQVFHKEGDQVTYDEVSKITKIEKISINDESKISVQLLKESKPRNVNVPEMPMTSIADLVYFKSLSYFETYENKLRGIDALKEMPNLKTLVLQSEEISTELLEEIAAYSLIESLHIPFLDVDYSCLSQIPTLKNIIIENTFYREPSDFSALLTLPSEGCLLNLGFIYHEMLTQELFLLFTTHTNISELGILYIEEGRDLSFFKHLKDLERIELHGESLDLSGISQMSWLKELTLVGNNIDVSKLLNLLGLEQLELRESQQDGKRISPFSVKSLAEYPSLKSLSLNGYVLETLDGIEVYSQLKSFSSKGSLIEDISALKKLEHLEYLALDDNLISDISALQYLKNLKYLSLWDNEISDISFLKNCKNLEYLCLSGNFIKDISPLTEFPKLKELRVEGNFSMEEDGYYIGNAIEMIRWRNVLLSLPDLKYYVGGPLINKEGAGDEYWISQNLPGVKYGYSDVGKNNE